MLDLLVHSFVPRAGTEVPAYLGPTAALVVAAGLVGYLCVRLSVVPIVGFLLAGVLIGPAQLGLVATTEAVDSAAEVGVILLLFTIGIEFSLERLARVWRWIVVGGGAQVCLAVAAAFAVVTVTGGSWQAGLFTGFLLALSSTAIVLKLLSDSGETGTVRGRLALSTLIFQDLAVVGMVLVVPLLGADADGGAGPLLRAVGVAVAVIALVLVVARRVMPPVLEKVAAACSPEVFLLAVIAICFGTAYLTALAGVSVSLGAFLAGLVVSESRHSTHAFAEVLPLQIIFSAVFFVSVGMLLDLGFLVTHLPLVLGAALLVLLLKLVTTTLALGLLPGVAWRQAAAAALLLGQVGEFSFVLVNVGDEAGLTPAGLGEEGSQTFVATTVLLMVLTPLLAAAGARLSRDAATGAAPAGAAVEAPAASGDGAPPGQVVFLGWGPDTVALARDLADRGVPVSMTTLNPSGAAAAEEAGIRVVRGDATRQPVLAEAGVYDARLVVVAEDALEQAEALAAVVRPLTDAPLLVRTDAGAEVAALARAGADHLVDASAASRLRLHEAVLDRLGESSAAVGGSGRGANGRTWADTTRIVDLAWPPDSGCAHAGSLAPVLPATAGCAVCVRDDVAWVHLRVCLTCGHVGCCDSSPGRHAREHAESEGHPLMGSLEPGETWGYCFLDGVTVEAAKGRGDVRG